MQVRKHSKVPAFKSDVYVPVPKQAGYADCKILRILELQPAVATVCAFLLVESVYPRIRLTTTAAPSAAAL